MLMNSNRKLIDADALIEAMTKFSNAIGEDMTHGIFYAHIAPTIDAVPIEWILNNERMPKEGKGHDAIMDMITDWRREHDTDD